MGLLDNETQQDYYNGDAFGGYQFTSLNDIINQFIIAYVGEDKLIGKVKRTEVAFHAQRAMQELSFDTFKSCKSQEITLPPSLTMKLPQDYVNYTKVCWIDDSGIEHPLYPTGKTSNPQKILQNDDGTYYSNLISNGDFNTGITSWSFWDVDGVGGSSASGGGGETQINWSVDDDGVLLTSNGLQGTYATSEPKFRQQVLLEDGEEYTFSYNITSISDNFGTTTAGKIMIQSTDDDTYLPVDISPTTTGTNSVTFIWDATNAGSYPAVVSPPISAVTGETLTAWVTIQLSAGDTLEKSISIKDIMLVKTKNDGGYDLAPTGTINSEDTSTTSSNYISPTSNLSNNFDPQYNTDWDLRDGYGMDPQHSQANGTYYIDCGKGLIHFSSNISGKTVVLKYISDGLGTDEEMKVHKFAEEAMYKWLMHAILSTRRGIQEYAIARYRKEKIAAIRRAKLRLSNIKLEEIVQVLRGKSKWIKH